MKIDLDTGGLSAVLTGSAVSALVMSAANEAAAEAEAAYPEPHSDGPVEVVVEKYVASGGRLAGERTAASLVAKHAAALGYEAQRGVLVRAARAAGLEVKAG